MHLERMRRTILRLPTNVEGRILGDMVSSSERNEKNKDEEGK